MNKPNEASFLDFFIIVPFYNEEKAIGQTLASLAAQTDTNFRLILVNNNSSDQSLTVIEDFKQEWPDLKIECISEPQKGTGAAADTGFRYAIGQGAKYLARTDADCLPDKNWVKNIKQAFAAENLEFVIGKIKPRTDEGPLSWRDWLLLYGLVFIAENFGKLLRHGKQFKYSYIMVAGNNLAVTAQLYEAAGGFPRTRIEDVHEDKVFSENIRTITKKARKKNNVVVYNSLRRAKKFGYWNTLMWYWDHKYRPQPHEVDVR